MSNKDYTIAIKDANGITINGSTKKINNGGWISLTAQQFQITYKGYENPRNTPNTRLKGYSAGPPATPATTWNDRKGSVIFSGIENPVITVQCTIDLNDVSPTTYTTGSGTVVTRMTLPLLYYLAIVPNTYYIRDYFGSGTADTVIGQLQNTTDYFTQTGWGTPAMVYGTDGMPVKIRSISGVSRSAQESEMGHILKFNIEFVEVRE